MKLYDYEVANCFKFITHNWIHQNDIVLLAKMLLQTCGKLVAIKTKTILNDITS